MKRPAYQALTIAQAKRRNWKGFILQQKLDGRWLEKDFGGTVFVGELMPDKAFIPFDCVAVRGQSIANEPLDRKSTRLNSRHVSESRMPSSA